MSGAIGYARVSTDEQRNENNSLAVQTGKISAYCDLNNLPLRKTFEASESARTIEHRPELQTALTYCRENRTKVSQFVVSDLSRLARNNMDQCRIIVTLKGLGIAVVSIDEPLTDDSAMGQFVRNMYGSINQLFSDQLSERTRHRMREAVKAGRFPFQAPIGYTNKNKQLYLDQERAPLVRQAFELIDSGRYVTTDAVLKVVTALGLRTKKGLPVSKQTFARMVSNPIYAGYVVSGDVRAKGIHEPIISDELYRSVQLRLNPNQGGSHKKLNEDFPLRGVVRCASCGKFLTAGWVQGRTKRYAHYWCWTPGCRNVNVSRDDLHTEFVGGLLGCMQPTAEFIAQLPGMIAERWKERKEQIANDKKRMNRQLADQRALNQKAIVAKLNEEITGEDYAEFKKTSDEIVSTIEVQIKALDSEHASMEAMLEQAAIQAVDLVGAWEKGNVNQRQELAKSFFPKGLVFSNEREFFEPANTEVMEMYRRWFADWNEIGAPNGI